MELMTLADKDKLEQQLANHIASDKVLVERIAEARAQGDLRENAEYHASREDKSLNDAKITELRRRIKSVCLIDESTMPRDMVFLGAMVQVRDDSTGDLELIRLVATRSDEEPDGHREVTTSSPMGIALMRARVGETVRVVLPRGERRLCIIQIQVG
ncbi:MAG: GreA/GreB family elongation factor [Planctomycetota bacterium]|nr:GreA/GreB family elongation factor [Planctomycetota bacterium]